MSTVKWKQLIPQDAPGRLPNTHPAGRTETAHVRFICRWCMHMHTCMCVCVCCMCACAHIQHTHTQLPLPSLHCFPLASITTTAFLALAAHPSLSLHTCSAEMSMPHPSEFLTSHPAQLHALGGKQASSWTSRNSLFRMCHSSH